MMRAVNAVDVQPLAPAMPALPRRCQRKQIVCIGGVTRPVPLRDLLAREALAFVLADVTTLRYLHACKDAEALAAGGPHYCQIVGDPLLVALLDSEPRRARAAGGAWLLDRAQVSTALENNWLMAMFTWVWIKF